MEACQREGSSGTFPLEIKSHVQFGRHITDRWSSTLRYMSSRLLSASQTKQGETEECVRLCSPHNTSENATNTLCSVSPVILEWNTLKSLSKINWFSLCGGRTFGIKVTGKMPCNDKSCPYGGAVTRNKH